MQCDVSIVSILARAGSKRRRFDEFPTSRVWRPTAGLWLASDGCVRPILAFLAVSVTLAISNGFCKAEDAYARIYCDRVSRCFIYMMHDTEVLIWNVDKSQLHARFCLSQPELDDAIKKGPNEPVRVAVGREGRPVVLVTNAGRVVFDTKTGEVVSIYEPSITYRWYYREAERMFLVGQEAGDGGEESLVVLDALSGKEHHRWKIIPLTTVCDYIQFFLMLQRFHPSGLVAFYRPAYYDGKLLMWDLEAGKELYRTKVRGTGLLLEFAPDGERFVIIDDNVPEIRDVKTGKTLARLTATQTKGHSGEFSPCGKYVLLATESKRAVLWEWQRNVVKQTDVLPDFDSKAKRESPPYFHAMFSSDGKRIAIAARDLSVYEYDTVSGELLRKTTVVPNVTREEYERVFCTYR